MRELMDSAGMWVIIFLCCGWPMTWAAAAVWAYRRYEARGLAGFIPRIGTRSRYE